MSRSALWRQEGNVKERERNAEELFRAAVEEGRAKNPKNLLQIWGPDDSFHFNPMLLQNITKSTYFQKACRELHDWNSIVDEIYYQVTHLEPWTTGGSKLPSPAFCLLLRLLALRCTEKQMTLLLDHVDSPYIRGIGFLYLRYSCPPEQVWKWIQPYLYDEEPISIKANASKTNNNNETIGSFVRHVFNTRSYHGTTFPRWPIQIERDIQVNLLQAEKVDIRAKQHYGNRERMAYFQKLGSKVRALYGDDENPIEWYDGVVDRVITRDDETNQTLKYPKFVVTFPEYGNTEIVTLGEMDMPDGGSKSKSSNSSSSRGSFSDHGDDWRRNHGGGRGRADNNNNDNRAYRARDNDDRGDRYGDRGGYGNRDCRGRGVDDDDDDRWGRGGRGGASSSKNDLYEEVRRRERETVTTNSRNGAARRPPSTKSVMAASSDRRSHYDQERHRSRSPPSPPRGGSDGRSNSNSPPRASSPPKKRSAEELAAIRAKKQKLLAKYG